MTEPTVGMAHVQTSDRDDYAGTPPDKLDPAVIRELSKLAPWRSARQIAIEWLAILAAAWLCELYFSPFAYIASVVFIGARQHGLLVLAHDAAHYRLTNHRDANDWLGEVFLAWPFLLVTMQGYRRNHFPHHRFVNTEQDPDWVRKQNDEWRFPMSRTKLALLLLQDLVGVGFLKFMWVALRLPKPKNAQTDRRARAFARGRMAFLVALVATLSALSLWLEFLLYWVVPYVTWMQLCFHVRSIAEHFGIRGRDGVYAQTRTVLANVFDRLFLVPNHVGYHLEHHLYPSVPFYRLPELHARLMELPGYRAGAHVTRGYANVLRECTAEPPRVPALS